jgi:hypothetical protein
MVHRKFAPHAAHILWESANEYMDYNTIAKLLQLRDPDVVAGSRTLANSVLRDIRDSGWFHQRAKQRPFWRLNEKGLEYANKWFGANTQKTPKETSVNAGKRVGLPKTDGVAQLASAQLNDATRRRKVAQAEPNAIDLAEPPKRMQATINRICRDTARARRVKELHDYRCQIKGCRHRIKLPDGLFYAEAHHVQPLGRDHKGPDIEANILCVCPTHHAELDLGVIEICLANLRRVEGHEIEKKYLDYHNGIVMTLW